jgi:hypothetical protein
MLTIFIECSGGVVTGAFTDGLPVNVVVIDYDETIDERKIMIPQSSGEDEPAGWELNHATYEARSITILERIGKEAGDE